MQRWIRNFFDTHRPKFEKEGRFHRYHGLFEAFETIFFLPDSTTSQSPHIRDSLDLKRFMSIVILAIVPVALFGIYNTGFYACLAAGKSTAFLPSFMQGLLIFIPLLVVSYGVGFFWEALFAVRRGHGISEGFLVSGLLYPLILPPDLPLWQAAIGISFGVVIGKEIFGGTGRNLLNPALTARAFVFFAYPGQMSGDAVWISGGATDAVSGATALAISAQAEPGSQIPAMLDQAGLGLFELFVGRTPGSIGETSALLCLVGALILIITGVANWRIMVGGVLGVLGTGMLLNQLATGSLAAAMGLPAYYHLVMGGFAFGIVFMATDPVTAPGTDAARWLYGFLIGALTVLIRVFNPAYPEGTMLAILFMNLFAPLLDHFVIQIRLRKRISHV
ncbi:Na+-transporting NADH:ubiquinone oxidoreductase subunit B [Desulfobotulus alkaliphilus]|uniref:Na(+)-translocating NADH-quinone reductase subunit B n=1 Tax=Desulfobotulus alkaliphilus TaxID=622671 RepID=A0A562S470_9BACT|nr:NADH:ubiquinone reductase (Na(+)-transporting) subunit B [Desulfobotulus alkaliphilus]TWI75370.1 Na+-transporting NADH:ubiquinone oxidoreductase subunit B [Desulfobotulus alkaliphilus]